MRASSQPCPPILHKSLAQKAASRLSQPIHHEMSFELANRYGSPRSGEASACEIRYVLVSRAGVASAVCRSAGPTSSFTNRPGSFFCLPISGNRRNLKIQRDVHSFTAKCNAKFTLCLTFSQSACKSLAGHSGLLALPMSPLCV